MYFEAIKKEYLPEIAKLEKSSYPEEMQMGIYGLKSESRNWKH